MQTLQKLFGTSLTILCLSLNGCATSKSDHGIPNFSQVHPGMWRGGQPDSIGWLYLKSLGVTNVVKLNEQSESSDTMAELAGMTLYRLPVSFAQQIGLVRIPEGWFECALGAIPPQGTFIHCEHGQDRTGLFVAMYRVQFDDWSSADAEAEMLAHGFHKSLFGLWHQWKMFR